MRTIWKFPLEVTDHQSIEMPANAKVLSVADQAGVLTIWALVDPEAERELRHVWVFGTGHPVTVSGATFRGSVQQGPFVWHVFTDQTLMESMAGLF